MRNRSIVLLAVAATWLICGVARAGEETIQVTAGKNLQPVAVENGTFIQEVYTGTAPSGEDFLNYEAKNYFSAGEQVPIYARYRLEGDGGDCTPYLRVSNGVGTVVDFIPISGTRSGFLTAPSTHRNYAPGAYIINAVVLGPVSNGMSAPPFVFTVDLE